MTDQGQDDRAFHRADVLFILEWAAVAPGLGRWNVLLDSDSDTRLVSIVPPGAVDPGFLISRSGEEVAVELRAPEEGGVRVRRYASVRAAVLAICPLEDAKLIAVNEAMELLYPRGIARGSD